jgi:hypothetical protein
VFGERDLASRSQRTLTPPQPAAPQRTADQIIADRDRQQDEVFEEAAATGLAESQQMEQIASNEGEPEQAAAHQVVGGGEEPLESGAAADQQPSDGSGASSSLASYFHTSQLGSPPLVVQPAAVSLLSKESRYPSLPLLSQAVGSNPENEPAGTAATTSADAVNNAVACSLPNSPLTYSAGRVAAGLDHRPHGFTPIMPAPPQESALAGTVIAAPTPVVMLPPSSSLLISPPQPVPVMSPGILNTAFAPANPLLFSAVGPLAAQLPRIVSPPAVPPAEPATILPPDDIV